MSLPRLVIVLSTVSLLNDAASEMITPLLPLFLTVALGAGPAVVGLVEGVAEAAASLLKYQSGRLADRGWSPRGLVVGGYALSSLARPAIGLCSAWAPVLALRFLDRSGKGIRTSPRDALISASVPEAGRGHAFGFHRGMDHVGSIIGPLLATALLSAGAGAIMMGLLVFGLRDHEAPAARTEGARLRWRDLDGRLRALVIAAGALALAVTPEAFLVLWATQNGVGMAWIPLLWSAASAVKSAVAYGGGRLSDTVGRMPILLGGWATRILMLVALAFLPAEGVGIWVMFLAYGATLAISEGPERALIGDVAPAQQQATAFGLYYLVYGILALPGGVIFGTLWQRAGSGTAFIVAAGLTALGMLTMLALARQGPR